MPYKDINKKREFNRAQARRLRAKDPKKYVEAVLRTRDPKKHRVRAALAYAKRTGKIDQQPCEVCGSLASEAHHDDYDRPLDVRWRCRIHHAELHPRAETG